MKLTQQKLHNLRNRARRIVRRLGDIMADITTEEIMANKQQREPDFKDLWRNRYALEERGKEIAQILGA